MNGELAFDSDESSAALCAPVPRLDPVEVVERRDPDNVRFREGWAAVLVLAVLDYWCADPASARWRSARDWIFYSGERIPNSFQNVAAFLGIEPQSARLAIARRHSEFSQNPAALTGAVARMRRDFLAAAIRSHEREYEHEQDTIDS